MPAFAKGDWVILMFPVGESPSGGGSCDIFPGS